MTNLKTYLNDGANYQARAVLMFLQGYSCIESSWNKNRGEYDAAINVSRWENCREQGYVLSLMNQNRDQLNISFFEHRNSDSIHAVSWIQNSINSLTIDNAKFGDVYKNKHDTSYSVYHGQVSDMADWIKNEFENHWNNGMIKL